MGCHRLILVLAIIFSVEAASDLNYRLNIPIRPSSYAISITPYFDTNDSLAFTFDGEVTISLFTDQNTRQIKLHSEGLTFSASNVTVTRGATVLGLDTESPVTFDEKYTFVYVNLATELQSGVEYTLNIVYRGPIRRDLNGFYYNYYIENGVKKWLGATQMEPTHARKVFPCFDEPGLKATFTLTIDRPQSFQPSLANTKMQTSTPLNNGYVREVFFPTPIMSSYLVAFLVSEFRPAQQAVEGNKEIGIYARSDAANQTDYAFTFASKVVDALSNYFGIDYYSTDSNLKLDHVALPDFRAGAMENWGLIKYRESLLLYVPEESTPYFKYRVAQIVAHETTHMWFGNLVTCHWWSNTWLNEGFANYFQDYITSMVDTDVGSVDQLVIGSVYSAYDADDDTESVPITNENVNSPAEISGHFGTITYQKAGSVIRMMHHLLGDDAFKIGLNSYLEANKFDSGYPELMYTALGQGVNVTNALGSYTGSNIHDIMDSWISQAGHPVLKVDVDYENGTVSLTQERFNIDEDHETSEVYQIPITYTTSLDPDFNNTKPAFIMDTKFHMFTMSTISQNHSWIIFNIQETGLYRVDYDDHTWHLIINALRGDDRTTIHHLNRAKIINDLFALFYADEVDFEIVYEGLQFLHEETDYSVIFAALRGLNKLRHTYLGTTALDVIKESQVNLLDSLITNVGYDIQAGEGTVAQRNRMQVLEYACTIGHQGCIDRALYLFRGLRDNGTEISPSLRPVAYCTGLRYGNGEDFEFLWDRMVATNTANEMTIIGTALGCTTDQDKLRKYLVSMQVENSPIRTQDLTVPLVSILTDYNNVELILDELKNGYEQWNTIYTTMDSVVSMIGTSLHTEEEFEKFTTWFTSCAQCTEQVIASAGKALGKAKSVAGWARGHQEEILRVLRNNAFLKTPSVTLLALSFVVIWLKF